LARILRGQNWNPGLRAPLTEPGVDARAGDYLIAVNGKPVAATDNLYAAFENTAGKQVELRLSANAGGGESRTVTVVPIGDESGLRQRQWVEDNRRRVDEKSGGRLGYIYMPDTGDRGMAAFDRDYYSQLDKEGLVIDERYNGGGKVADYVIETLSRQVMCYWMNREEWLARTPFGTFEGPKVMIINENAGSGGDAMPWLFKQAGLGPLVGTRTWGGLVGLSGTPPLVDGGSVTAASFGVMDRDGNWAVENVGVAPDHEVIEWPKPIIEGADPQLDKAIDLALADLAKKPARAKPAYKPPEKR
jgi:tricorn protease